MMLITSMLFAQSEKERGLAVITESSVKGSLEFLSSDWTEGRAVGTKGAYMAADYIASMFQVYGIKPLGDELYTRVSRADRKKGIKPELYNTYFQNFSLIEYKAGDVQTLSLIDQSSGVERILELNYETDFYVRTSSVGQSSAAPLVFAGYGFSAEGYDDLKKIDCKGKIAVILSGFPGHADEASAAYEKYNPKERYGKYYLEREKIDRLKDAGAVAVIKVEIGADPMITWAKNNMYQDFGGVNEVDKYRNPYYSTRLTMPGQSIDGGLPTFTVTPRVVETIFDGSDIDLQEFEEKAATELQAASQSLKGKSMAYKTTVESKVVKARNVLGYIEGERKDEFIVVGGHYDHLGMSEGIIYNGADDNASGTVGVMTIAKAVMATGKKPEKSIVFAAWTGEEKGLFGSKYFVQEAMKDGMDIDLYLNYDMISRNPEGDTLGNMAHMSYTKANAMIGETTTKNIEAYDINLDLDLRPQDRPGGGSDHAPFSAKDIPVFYFMAAMHPDYHKPTDELSKINWEKTCNIIKVGFLNVWDFANDDSWMVPETK